MVKLCNTCGKEFDERLKGVRYSSSIKGLLFFCSDNMSDENGQEIEAGTICRSKLV
jgi:hypothetical protein